jgi:hypothetical protein
MKGTTGLPIPSHDSVWGNHLKKAIRDGLVKSRKSLMIVIPAKVPLSSGILSKI